MMSSLIAKSLWALMLLAWLSAFGAWAEEPSAALPSPGLGNGQTIVFTVSGPPALEKQALGLSLLMQDLLARNGRKVASAPDIERNLRSAGFWREDRAVLTKDIPYLANSLVASVFIQGRLEEGPDGWRLDLRLYDVAGGHSLDSRELQGKAGDVAWLLESCAAISAFWLATEPFAKESGRLAPDEAKALTLAELALANAPFNEDNLRRLAEFLATSDDVSATLGGLLAHKIEAVEKAAPLARALRADLTGDTSQAIAAYEALEVKGPLGPAIHARTVALLRRLEQNSKAQNTLRGARSREPGNPLLGLAAAQLALEKDDWQAAEAELAKLGPEQGHPSADIELATLLSAKKQPKKRAQALLRAALSAYSHKMFAISARAAFELAQLEPELVAPAWLDARYLSEAQRVALIEKTARRNSSREQLLAMADLLNGGQTRKAAGAFYERAVRQEPYDADTFAKAGRYFAEQMPSDRRGPLYLKVALALKPDHPGATLAMARLLAQTGQCPKSLAAATFWAENHPRLPMADRLVAELFLSCQDVVKAEKLIDAALAEFPDDAHMLALKIRADLAKHSLVEAQMHYARLTMIDKKLAERLGPPKINALEVKLAAADGDQGEPGQNALTGKLAEEGAGGGSPYKDLEALQEELGDKLAASNITLDLAGLSDMLEKTPPGELQRMAAQLGLKSDIKSAQTQLQRLYLVNSGAKPVPMQKAGVSLMELLKSVAENAKAQREAGGGEQRDAGREQRSFFGWLLDPSHPSFGKTLVWLALLMLVAAAGLLVAYACRRICGKSAFTAKILYNRSFHAGHFIGVLNAKKQETDITHIRRNLKRLGATDGLQAFWNVLFPYKTVAQRDVLTFRNIPPGDYYLTVASIQIDPKTELPIGSIEAYRRVHIAPGQQREDIRFEEDVAYIGVRVDSLLRASELGRNVIVTLEENPQVKEQGKVGEEIALHLPPGEHTIRALAGAMTFRQKVTVDKDLRSQWVQFRMEDQKCVIP